MKSKIRRKKRVTFIRLFASFFAVAVLLSLVFANLFREVLIRDIRNEVYNELMMDMSQTQAKISQLNEICSNPIKQLDAYMSLYTNYGVFTGDIAVNSGFDENCYAVSAIIDEETNTIVASNKQKLTAFLKLKDDERMAMYSCDRELFNIPQLDELFDNYSALCYNISFNSIYVNEDDYSFVPHNVIIEKIKYYDDNVLTQTEIIDTEEIVIDFDDENYQLINLNKNYEKKAPCAFLIGFHGYDKFNDVVLKSEDSDSYYSSGWFYDNNLLNVSAENTVYIDGKTYTLYMLFVLDENCDSISKFYWKYTIIFSLTAIVLAFILSLTQHIINKTRYAFEDYQKVLINNLAHDLKTPLTAIGGYAENAGKCLENGSPEKIKPFIDAITENVFYTDSVVNRTLELNHLNKIKEVKKSAVQVHKIVETSLEKYSLILDEKHISVELNGEFEIMADPDTIKSAIENLISNAVKYTVENGRIIVKADKKSVSITNDIAQNIDTKNLTMPFVKGDKSRNDKSCGIGLAIVQSTAELNRLKLTLASSGNKFTATLTK